MRSNHGKPAVVFPASGKFRGYELHGTQARDWYSARDKALAVIREMKAR